MEICADGSVNLGGATVGSGGTEPYTYSWSPADDLDDATAEKPLFTPSGTGPFTYTVTVTDANLCEDTDDITVTVNSVPLVTLTSDDADNSICSGQDITFTATATAVAPATAIVQYDFYVDDGSGAVLMQSDAIATYTPVPALAPGR